MPYMPKLNAGLTAWEANPWESTDPSTAVGAAAVAGFAIPDPVAITTGGSPVVIADADRSVLCRVTAGGTIAAKAFTMPPSLAIGKFVYLFSNQNITAFTVTGSPTIVGGPSSLTANEVLKLQKTGATSWLNVSG